MTKQYDLTLDAERRLLRAAHIAPAAKAQSLQSYFESQGVTFLPGCDAVLNSQKARVLSEASFEQAQGKGVLQ